MQQFLQHTIIITEMGNTESFACPVPTSVVLIVAVEIHCMIESSCCDPFQFFRWVWQLGLDGWSAFSSTVQDTAYL
jgi:hypothetical protein